MFGNHEAKQHAFQTALVYFLYLHISGFSVPTFVSLIARNLLFIVLNLMLIVILLHSSGSCHYENHTNTAWLRTEPLEKSSNIPVWTFSLGLEEQIHFTCFSCLLTMLLAVFIGAKETSGLGGDRQSTTLAVWVVLILELMEEAGESSQWL